MAPTDAVRAGSAARVPILLIGFDGFAGASACYLVDGRITALTGGALPWGTFAINGSGSFLVGMLFALLVERRALPAVVRGPLMIGFLGAYSTTGAWRPPR